MAILSVPNEFITGQVPTASEFNANFDAIETFVNTTKLDTANIKTNKSLFSMVFSFASVGNGDKLYAMFKVPAGSDFVWSEVQVGMKSTTGTGGTAKVSITNTTSGGVASDVLDADLTQASADAIASSTSFDTATSTAGSTVRLTLEESGTGVGTIEDVTITMFGKVLIKE